ncbi:MAG: DUF1045 domain-containing protein [bacterium]|nr:DUF1045 domain-containing protein [bacterium]
MNGRFAVYYTPATTSELARFAADWLGGKAGAAAGIPEDLHRDIVRIPAAYGFHATLKAPFALAPGATGDELATATAALAADFAAFRAPPLDLANVDGFLALVLRDPCPAMNDLAAACVTELDHFRAPLTDRERERRVAQGLSARQEALLDRWGYPFVLDEFLFHMTLTRCLGEGLSARIADSLERRLGHLIGRQWCLDSVSLFHQASLEEPFTMRARFPLGHLEG